MDGLKLKVIELGLISALQPPEILEELSQVSVATRLTGTANTFLNRNPTAEGLRLKADLSV